MHGPRHVEWNPDCHIVISEKKSQKKSGKIRNFMQKTFVYNETLTPRPAPPPKKKVYT